MAIGFVFLFVIAIVAQTESTNILCYYEGWINQSGDGSYPASSIPADKCSHIVYSFIDPASGGKIKSFTDGATLNKLVALKKQNSKLKVMVSIGGWNDGSTVFSSIVGNSGYRTNFVNALSSFISQYKLDGIDIDWEYPDQRGGVSADKANNVEFLKELRAKLGTSKVITAAVGADPYLVGSAYDVKGMNQYLSFINLMSYDMHSSDDKQTGQNSPLYASNLTNEDKSLNIDAVVSNWIKNGATPSKIHVGLGFYGHTFKLANSANHGLGAATSGPGPAGPYSEEAGLLTYLEICKNLKAGGWTTVYDSQQQCPYSFKGNEWVGYDNVQSIKAKSQYTLNRGLGGVMMWALDNDDFHNVCGGGATPLLNAINSVIKI